MLHIHSELMATPEHPHSGIPAGVAALLWNTVHLTAERKEDAVRAHL